MTSLPLPCFDHLLRLTDGTGVFEHARYSTPRRSHGYTIDDNARALMVTARAGDPSLDCLSRTTASLLSESLDTEGRVRNRLSADGIWSPSSTAGDTLGRVWQALGAGVQVGPEWLAKTALGTVDRLAHVDVVPLRPSAFAAIGVAALLAADPSILSAQAVAGRTRRRLLCAPAQWGPWPERRLTYANARVPEAMMALGAAVGDDVLFSRGLTLLEWLVGVERCDGHWSFTPVGGRSPSDLLPGFDQQPVEAAAMADAAYRAWRLTGDARWADAVLDTGRWLMGANDAGVPLYDSGTGGCADGLQRGGVNANRGAESTLSGLMVLLRCRDVGSDCEPREQPLLIDNGSPDGPIGGTIGQENGPVGASVGSLHKDHTIDVAGPLPIEQRNQQRLRKDRQHPSGRGIEERYVGGVRPGAGPLVIEEQQPRVRLDGRCTGPDAEGAK